MVLVLGGASKISCGEMATDNFLRSRGLRGFWLWACCGKVNLQCFRLLCRLDPTPFRDSRKPLKTKQLKNIFKFCKMPLDKSIISDILVLVEKCAPTQSGRFAFRADKVPLSSSLSLCCRKSRNRLPMFRCYPGPRVKT